MFQRMKSPLKLLPLLMLAFVAIYFLLQPTMSVSAIKLTCRFCSFTNSSIKDYLSHQTIHRHVNRHFPCGVDDCKCVCTSEAYLRTHLIRVHGLQCKQGTLYPSAPVVPSSRDGVYVCSLAVCKKKFHTCKDLSKHLRMHLLSGIAIRCPFPACTQVYRNVSSFSCHMSRMHRGKEGPVQVPCDDPSNFVCAEMLPEIITAAQTEDTIEETIEPILFDHEVYQECLATFFLKLEFQCLIPARTVQYISKEFQLLHEQSYNEVSSKLKKKVLQENITAQNLETVLREAYSTHQKSHHNLRSSHTRTEFYKKKFDFVKPEKLPLVKPKCYFFYVPIAETLKAAFRDKSITISLEPPVQLDPNILEDITDGLVYKNNPFFQQNPRSIRLMLYQDGFQVCAGYGKNKHKITGVYMSILNIPRHIRTHVNSIHLVALYKDKEFNHTKVYGQIVKDLKDLETNGVLLPQHGTVKAGLVCISGDNLGHHSVGGFNENFSRSTFFCRYCLVDRASFHANHYEQFPLRTPESYNDCLRAGPRHRMGVKFDSEFNKLDHFHVCNPGLASCLAHDLHEGVVAHDLALFVNYFVSEKWFTVPELNEKIDSFKYNCADYRDKPNTFTEGCEKISGGAMQIWCFLRLLPLLIKDLVDDWEEKQNNLVWRALLLLSEIVELVSAPYSHTSVLAYLESIVYDYLDLRKLTFPGVLLRPKHHYLTHYSFLVYFFGGLAQVWTMRFESKHSFFKRFARMLKNFRNILFSFSLKHELFMSYLRTGVNLQCEIKPNVSGEFHGNLYSLDIQRAFPENLPDLMQECASIVVKGTVYKKGMLLLVQQTHYQCEVQFGRIVLILHDNNLAVFFLVEVLEAEFIEHLRVYKLGVRKMYRCVEHSSLLSYSVVRDYKIGTATFVRLQSSIFCGNVLM